MKAIYTLFGPVTETDFDLIRQAFNSFKHIYVAIQLPLDTCGKDFRDHVSDVRRGCQNLPISLDFFREGELESYLKNSGAASWIVPQHCPSDLIAAVDFDNKHYI